jgi:hypothetical protein
MTGPLPSEDEQRLLRLLTLKRYETPPPGFFDQLPRRVLLSVRAGVELEELPWWERLRALLLREPMVAGSYAALGLGALLFGVSVFETARGAGEPAPVVLQGSFAGPSAFVAPSPASLPSGVIYRVVPTETAYEWLSPEGLPAARLERIGGILNRQETRPAALFLEFPR